MGVWVFPLVGGARLILEVDGSQALAVLQVRDKQGRDLLPFLEEAAAIVRQSLGRDFAEGGRPSWKPLAISTVAAKRGAGMPARTAKGRIPWRLKQSGQFGAAGILIFSGRLRDSYRVKNHPDHIEVYDAAGGTVTVGSRVPYSKIHQKGCGPYEIRAKFRKALAFPGSAGATILRRAVKHPGLPARAVGLATEDHAAIAAAFRRHLAGERFPQRAA
jgi:phage gpG-like protein